MTTMIMISSTRYNNIRHGVKQTPLILLFCFINLDTLPIPSTATAAAIDHLISAISVHFTYKFLAQ